MRIGLTARARAARDGWGYPGSPEWLRAAQDAATAAGWPNLPPWTLLAIAHALGVPHRLDRALHRTVQEYMASYALQELARMGVGTQVRCAPYTCDLDADALAHAGLRYLRPEHVARDSIGPRSQVK